MSLRAAQRRSNLFPAMVEKLAKRGTSGTLAASLPGVARAREAIDRRRS